MTVRHPLNIPANGRRYDVMVGTGGIGGGAFFALNGNHTLGREESRNGRFLDRRDYCKLHIVAHYVQTLLGPVFQTFPVGAVGADDPGDRTWEEMLQAGLSPRFVRRLEDEQTLYCVCLVYPDGTGGNLTVDDSASARVTPEDVEEAGSVLARAGNRGIALAVPEVPLETRLALLRLGTEHASLRAASFLSQEMDAVREQHALDQVDLLALNADEAGALVGLPATMHPGLLAAETAQWAAAKHPSLRLSITAGASGSWVWDTRALHHLPACRVEASSTAGAGDAHVAGLLVGLASGILLANAHELACLMAGLSVTSPHTLHHGIDRKTLQTFADALCRPVGPETADLLLTPATP